MVQKSKIEWTTMTWNPVRGCSRVSKGCDNCYAERMASRFSGPGLYAHGFAKRVHGRSHWTGRVELIPHKLFEPISHRQPRKIFVNSMSDLFHENLPDSDIDRVFSVIARRPQHTFQILTKRPEHMRSYSQRLATLRPGDVAYDAVFGTAIAELGGKHSWPLPNVWLGVSVEDEDAAATRIPLLRQTPAAVRWISYEPALGPVDWERWLVGIDWVVCGGESGPGARPMQPDWARTARDACMQAGVPFFFKQWGDWAPDGNGGMKRVGKLLAGRMLNGRTHDEFPK